jgi:thiol-disulfide isomerase/thioredoxin
MRTVRTVAALVTGAVLVLPGARASAGDVVVTADPPLLKAGDPAPEFKLEVKNPAAAGVPRFVLSNHAGPDASAATKGVLVSFFATYCGPCKKELPFLAQLQEKYRAQGLQVVSVMVFDPNQTAEEKAGSVQQASELFAKAEARFPLVHDTFGFVARRYLGLKFPLPSVFLVKRDGTIALVKQGYDEDASAFLTAEVEKLIGG